jgi:hypothetical protein
MQLILLMRPAARLAWTTTCQSLSTASAGPRKCVPHSRIYGIPFPRTFGKSCALKA